MVATASSYASVQRELLVCPACSRPISAAFSLELDPEMRPAPSGDFGVVLSAKVAGIRVVHDCTPKATR